jgi:hypothetical protein
MEVPNGLKYTRLSDVSHLANIYKTLSKPTHAKSLTPQRVLDENKYLFVA